MAGFNILFAVVPEAAGVGHEERQEQACDDVAHQEPANRLDAADKAHRQGGQDGD